MVLSCLESCYQLTMYTILFKEPNIETESQESWKCRGAEFEVYFYSQLVVETDVDGNTLRSLG